MHNYNPLFPPDFWSGELGVEQTYTWQDALTVASWLNAMHRHANVIGFATWAQMVNVIAPIQADRNGSVRQTVFHPLSLYAKECGDIAVAARCDSPWLDATNAKPSLPALDISATRRAKNGILTLAVVNRHPTDAIAAMSQIAGGNYVLEGGQELTAPSLSASNSVLRPSQDCVQVRRVTPTGNAGTHEFPARSITLLQFSSDR